MGFTMERWYSAVGQRFAVRRYAGSPDPGDMHALWETAQLLSAKGVRVAICTSDKVFAPIFMGYGRIKGTNCFAAFLLSKEAPAYAEGYLGEALALECAALGLGSCWLGQYNKKAALAAVSPAPGETLGCIMAIGKPGEPYAARPRKNLDKLTGLTQSELQDLPEWQQRAIECARLAPSAVNGQPWRFAPGRNCLRVVDAGKNMGYGELDRGIAMLHIELGAAHCGAVGEWSFLGSDAIFTLFAGGEEEPAQPSGQAKAENSDTPQPSDAQAEAEKPVSGEEQPGTQK